MQIAVNRFPYNDIYIIPINDLHVGDRGFTANSRKKLRGYINWIKKTPNAYSILGGDLCNVATRTSKTSPFEQNLTLEEQITEVVKLLSPIKGKILGAINGNHEQRLSDYTGYSPTIAICRGLGIKYMSDSGIYILRMGCRKHTPRASFTIYHHHTTGGSRTVGGKMNRIAMLRDIIPNCDCYVGGHNHMLGAIPFDTQVINPTTERLETIRQMIVDAGGYLEWHDTYAERTMLQPLRVGSPRIHFIIKINGRSKTDSIKRDIHVSL